MSTPIEYIDGKPVYDHNATNIRPAHLVRFGGVVAKLQDWGELYGLNIWTLRTRLDRGEKAIDALRPANHWKVQIPWELDFDAQAFVREHPDGALLEEVGDYFGLTRERIRQIQARALEKMATQLGPDWRKLLGETLGVTVNTEDVKPGVAA